MLIFRMFVSLYRLFLVLCRGGGCAYYQMLELCVYRSVFSLHSSRKAVKQMTRKESSDVLKLPEEHDTTAVAK